MKTYIKAYDHNENVWTVFSQEGDETRILKKAKSAKEVNEYLSKKPKIKEELNRFTKKDYAFDGIVDEAKIQRKIDREIKSKKLYPDDYVEIEKLSKAYKYRTDEVEEKKKHYHVKGEPSQAKYISNVGYFYTARYGGRLSMSQKNANRIESIRKTLRGFTKVEFTFTDENGNKFQTIIDKEDMVKDEIVLRARLGKAIIEHAEDDSLNSGKGKFSFRGIL